MAASLVVVGLLSGGASASRVVHVYPGPHAISRAVNNAAPGDTLVIHGGRYHEHVAIDKRLTLVDAVGDNPAIDADCDWSSTVDVKAHGVTLRGLRVVGGDTFEVNATFVRNLTLRRVVMRDTCGGAEYGVNLYRDGSVLVAKSRASGFEDAGIYVGGINVGPVTVRRNLSFGNNRGILIEDVAPGAVAVLFNTSSNNRLPGLGDPTGIWLHEADGVLVSGNKVGNNATYGIHLDDVGSSSDDNVIRGNTVLSNGQLDILDEGSGNCFSNNTYATSQPAQLPAC